MCSAEREMRSRYRITTSRACRRLATPSGRPSFSFVSTSGLSSLARRRPRELPSLLPRRCRRRIRSSSRLFPSLRIRLCTTPTFGRGLRAPVCSSRRPPPLVSSRVASLPFRPKLTSFSPIYSLTPRHPARQRPPRLPHLEIHRRHRPLAQRDRSPNPLRSTLAIDPPSRSAVHHGAQHGCYLVLAAHGV